MLSIGQRNRRDSTPLLCSQTALSLEPQGLPQFDFVAVGIESRHEIT
jgi:hypothetical protein